MKFSLSWLKTHLETDASLAQITGALNTIGLELEDVVDRGAALAPFRIAHVVEAMQHPNADRLRALRVDTGDAVVSVVCGAPNARAGMKAVFAPPGSVIPASGVVLKVGDIRGVQSAGMLLSVREMGLGDDHDGIVDLPADAPVGASYAAWAGLDDPVIEIAITPNRGDALSVRGVARDLAAAGLGTLLPLPPIEVPAAAASPLRWEIAWPEACPWVLGRAVVGLKNGPSPTWLQERLLSIGLRPINALVDVTNFFTFDLGRPLHVFDVDKIGGDTLTLRRGAGETFAALNGKSYTARAEDCVIADATGVQSLAGVMGGAASGCDAGTTRVFVECALFDPVRVALTGRHHRIASDARTRFERGVDAALPPAGLQAATQMILDLCGGTACQTVSAGAEPAWRRTARLRFDRVRDFGGLDLAADESVDALGRLGFGVAARDAGGVTVDVPSWRNDIAAGGPLDPGPDLPAARAASAAAGRDLIEPEADLIEEVLRLRGLDSIPPVSMPPVGPVPGVTLAPHQARSAVARRVLASRGLMECVTFSFVAGREAAQFGEALAELRLINPIAADLDQLRPTPIASLALAAGRNAARGWGDVGLFEIGPAWEQADAQRLVAAGLRAGRTPRHWERPARDVTALDAKADLWAMMSALGVPLEALNTTADAPDYYHPGQSGTVRQGPKTILAHFGTLHPRVAEALELAGQVVAFQLYLDQVHEPKRKKRTPLELPSLQPLRRDFAFLVDPATPAEAVLKAARNSDKALITAVSLFDVYEGDRLEPGKKSLAIEVVFQPRERTLTDAEIEAAADRLVAAVIKATGGVLRA